MIRQGHLTKWTFGMDGNKFVCYGKGVMKKAENGNFKGGRFFAFAGGGELEQNG